MQIEGLAADDEVERLVWEIEQIVMDENAGGKTNWDYHDPELFPLLVEWREAERQVKLIFDARHQAFIKAHYEKK